MLVVDAQVHLWSQGTPNSNHRQVAAFTATDALAEMDAAGVDAAVLHPPAWDRGSTALSLEAARRHPTRFAVLGTFDLDPGFPRPESRAALDRMKSERMLGVRLRLSQPPQSAWLTDGTLDWVWPAAERAGLPVALLVRGPSLPAVRRVAQRHPELKLIIDHFGLPDKTWSQLPELVALAQCPNVALKATGAPSMSGEDYPYRDIHGHLRRLYDAFGPERMFWGTDITRMPIPWQRCVTLFTEELPWLTANDKALIMGRALCAWLGWNLPP